MAIGAMIKSALEIEGIYILLIYHQYIDMYISLMHNYHKSIYRRTHQDPVPRSQGGEGQGHPQDPHIKEI